MITILKHHIGFALWSVTPVAIKGALYRRHRRVIARRTSCLA